MLSKSRSLFLFISLVGAVLSARAAVFELSNGDRISGEIVEQSADSVTIKMALGGATLKLPRSALKTPPSSVKPTAKPKPEVAKATPPPEPKADPPPPAEGDVAKKKKADTSPAERSRHRFREIPNRAYDGWMNFWEDNALFRTLARIYPLMDWNNQINAGFSLNSGKTDYSNLDLLFKTEKRAGKHQTRFQIQYELDQTTTATSIDEATGKTTYATRTTRDWWRGNARYRYDYVKAFFVQADTNYQRRLEKNIFHEVDEMLGIGYRWLDSERMEGSVTPSAGFGFRDVQANDPEWNWLLSVQQDFRFSLTDRLRLTQETVFTYEPNQGDANLEETGEIAFTLKAGLENQLNQRLSLNLRYEFNHDERIPEDRGQTTHGIRFNLGAKF